MCAGVLLYSVRLPNHDGMEREFQGVWVMSPDEEHFVSNNAISGLIKMFELPHRDYSLFMIFGTVQVLRCILNHLNLNRW